MEVEKYKMIYKIDKRNENLRLLGEQFVKNNKNKIKLIINNKQCKSKELISIDNIKADKFKIKMVTKNNIFNKSFMFRDCISLLEFSSNDFENLDNNDDEFKIIEEKFDLIEEIIDERDQPFYDCLKMSASEFSEIMSKKEDITDNTTLLNLNEKMMNINFNNVILRGMFYNCRSLISLPDISKWNTDNVIDISDMFFFLYEIKIFTRYINMEY